MSARGILVTGTDTGIGKTLVSRSLAVALAKRGRVHPFKPAETGCDEGPEGLEPDDAMRLQRAAQSEAGLDLICPYRFTEPLAPWVAAERAGRKIEPAHLQACYRALAEEADVVLVESAGGLLVPITKTYSFADLAADLGLSILVVVGSRLGALNQALLTLEYCRMRGLDTIGYVVNHLTAQDDLAVRTNTSALAALTSAPRVGIVPWLGDDPDDEALAPIGDTLVGRIFPELKPKT